MTLILVRFAELGLKSQRVRSRFIRMLASDIEESLVSAGIDHIMDVDRSRVFLDVEDPEGAGRVLRQVPGIFSFSPVMPSLSDRVSLMDSLSKYGAGTVSEGMTYGLRIRRTGETDYTSRDIAVEGGGAVVSHLTEGTTSVDLKHPDIWIEVEIRGRKAYIFHERVKGMGGMPASSQGRVLLFCPPLPEEDDARDEMVKRTLLSHFLMRRRGCRVIPVVLEKDLGPWREELEGRGGFAGSYPAGLAARDGTGEILIKASIDNDARGVIYPFGLEDVGNLPVLHGEGEPIPVFYPTVSMDRADLDDWLKDFFI